MGDYSIQKVLNAERFDLLSEDEQKSVNNLRDLGEIEPAYNQLSSDEIQGFKDIVNFFLPNSKEQEWTDYDYANMYQTTIGNATAVKEGVVNIATNPTVQKEVAIIGAGIAAPLLAAPITAGTSTYGLPIAITRLATKYPRLSKIVAAFTGSYTAAQPFTDTQLQAMGYGFREAAGEGIVQGISGAYPYVRKSLQTLAKKDLEKGTYTAVKQLESSGQILTPSIISNNRVIETLENLAENAWIGGGALRTTRKGAIEASQKNLGDFLNTKFVIGNKEMVNVTDDFVEVFLNNASATNMDIVLKEFITRGANVQKSLIKTGYRNLDTVIQKTTGNADIVNISGLKKFAANQAKVNIDEAAQKVLQQIAELPPNVSFATAQRLRSQFLEMTGHYASGGTTATGFSKAVAGGAQKIIDNSMDSAVKNLSKTLNKETVQQVDEAWRSVNALYKGSKETFNSVTMSKIINGNPDLVFSSLIKGKHPIRIKEFKNLIFNTAVKQGVLPNKLAAEQLWRKVQGEFFVDIIGKSYDEATGIISAKSILSKLKTFDPKAGRVLNELFSNNPNLLKEFKSFTKTLELAQSKGIKGVPGGMFIQLVQAGAIKGSAVAAGGVIAMDGNVSWGEAGAMAVILGGPKVISRMFTDPNFIKGIFNTTRHKIGSQMYTRGAVQTINSFLTQGLFTEDQAVSAINEGISVGSLHKNALKDFKMVKKIEENTLKRKENEKKVIKKVKEKTSEFMEWTGLS